MTKEELNENYAILEKREKALKSERNDLEKELETITYLKNVSDLKKAELKREVEIRRRLLEIDEELNDVQEKYSILDGEAQTLENEESQKKTSKRGKVILTVAVILAIALAFAAGKYGKDAKCDSCSTKNVKPNKSISTVTDMPESTNTTTVTPKATPVPTVAPVLVDVTNDEQVEKAAKTARGKRKFLLKKQII